MLLDVRTPEEFATGHLAGAQLMNFEAADFDARLATLDKNATYAVYCRSGNRSGQALERMEAAGFTHLELAPNPMPLHTQILVGRKSKCLPSNDW